MLVAFDILFFFFFPVLGASFLKKIHCGYFDGQLCFFGKREGWRRAAEGTKEGQKAPRQDELQVIHPFSLCYCQSRFFSPPSRRQERTNLSQDFFFSFLFLFMSDNDMENRCYVHPGFLQGNTDDVNL